MPNAHDKELNFCTFGLSFVAYNWLSSILPNGIASNFLPNIISTPFIFDTSFLPLSFECFEIQTAVFHDRLLKKKKKKNWPFNQNDQKPTSIWAE